MKYGQLCLREKGRNVLSRMIFERMGKGFSDVDLSYCTHQPVSALERFF